jgi:protein-disulfide isomerase
MSSSPIQNRLRRIAGAIVLTLLAILGGWAATACTVRADNAEGEPSQEASLDAPLDAPLDAKTSADRQGTEILARVEGEVITRTAVEEQAADELEQVRLELLQCRSKAEQKRHEVVEDTTRNMVRDRLLDAEAAERGVTKDQILAREVANQVAEVTDEDVRIFYEENEDRIGGRALEEIAPQVRQYLRQQRESAAYQRFISELEDAYRVAYEIEPYRVELDLEGEPAEGPASAPVTIVEFSDFECPFCGRVVPTLEKVRETYADEVRVVFKQFPLRRLHPHAQKAAEASLCARDQGGFWELHDAMFADQKALTVEDLAAKAEAVGLDVDAFGECLESGRHAEAVDEDLREGTIVGVSGTPALFVNGRMLSGAVAYETLAEVIDDELERQ